MPEKAHAAAELRKGDVILEVRRLKKYFPIKGGIVQTVQDYVRAVDDVSFIIRKGETLGVVGESGCGKTTLGRTILRLIERTDGEILFKGQDLETSYNEDKKAVRRNMQIVFQDPASSLNPRMTIKQIVGEPLKINGLASGDELEKRVIELLETVGLNKEHLHRFPHEFSGGQKQRIGVARALALNPAFIVMDEPTSALDVSVQAQVLNLLEDLQEEFDLTYLFITHALNVVNHISDRVAVMYLGRIVELAETEELFATPLHPYTKALLSAIPEPDPELNKQRILLPGDVPSPINPPSGCRFHPRCPLAQSICDWDGDRFAERLREHLESMAEGDRPRMAALFGDEAQWETTRSTFSFPTPDDPDAAHAAVARVLRPEVEEHYRWWTFREEEGRSVVDFEPQLHPGGGVEGKRAPEEDAATASEGHLVACFFAGREIPEDARGRISAEAMENLMTSEQVSGPDPSSEVGMTH